MYSFSERSLQQLQTCEPRLQLLFNKVIEYVDVTIIEGHRSDARQQHLFETGKSKLPAGRSMHNTFPSLAVDVAPYPIDWNDRERWLMFVGFVRGVAATMGIPIRCGADWDGDFTCRDQTFHDMPHFELKGE